MFETRTALSTRRKATALVTAGALLAVPAAVLVSTPAHADAERHGSCGGGVYELSADREGGGFEVGLDLDGIASGSKWRIVLRHDGERFFRGTRTADHEGDLDVERYRANTPGKDVFRFTAKRVNGSAGCSGKVVVR